MTSTSSAARARLQVEVVSIASLHEWDRNPRNISDHALERLKRSLEAEPQMLDARPVIALTDGTVVAGNMRLRAARELGWKTVPTVFVDLDENRAREWALRDNASYGEWDDAALADLMREMQDDGANLDLTGFDEQEFAAILESVEDPLPKNIDDAPPLPDEPRSVLGEVYELGPHRLMCGDATDAGAMAILMDGEQAACLWTDPPYGIEYESNGRRMRAAALGLTDDQAGIRAIQNDDAEGLPSLLAAAFATADSVLMPGAPLYIAHPAGPLSLVFYAAGEGIGWEFRQALIWDKGSMVLGRSDYHYAHESIIYGFKPAPKGRMGRGGKHWFGDHSQTSVFRVPKPSRSEEHPTMKPVELVRQMLANSLPPSGIVLDPFGGSGTTLIAAHSLRRRACLMELDPRYCDVIRARWETADYLAGS